MRETHGLRRHPLYGTWTNIKTRCYNQNFRQYPDYGGRGIGMCESWRNSVSAFIADIEREIGPRPPGLTLDRIDNDGNYEPGNVRWATRIRQAHNSRNYKGGCEAHPLYRTWWQIMRRVPDEMHPAWQEFWAFAAGVEALIGPRPRGLRFDRTDDSRPYAPGNISWVSGTEQIKRAQAARWVK